uniref:SPARC (osteonectin), cwcv and kazal like domains proteoglycan 2 n=1 Tax=Dromaius novaehollandiae TaxID=8790 RepID=A0A8C4PCI2_DRONO
MRVSGGDGTGIAPARGGPRGSAPARCPPSPGHDQGPVPEGEMQPAQGVRRPGLPARHVHQPQEAGAQVRGRRAVPGPPPQQLPAITATLSLARRIKPPGPKAREGPESACKPCPGAPLAAVCGSDGHTYSSACKLEQQACLASKQLAVKCEGQCPCATEHGPTAAAAETCTGQDLADLGDRLRDWFQLLRENAKQNGSGGAALDKSLAAGCKDAVGWMFARLDTSGDLFLEQAELAAINLDKYEVCIRAFFNSCDTHKDGRVSTAEWCFCFWREKPPCLRELEKIQIQEAAKKKPGIFIPSCDEDGYYRKLQCEQGGGECWCVDPLGLELTGTRGHGRPDCEDVVGFSGDFGSSVGWEDEEEKEPEEAGEEAEEEEGEAGEADDGGYIW